MNNGASHNQPPVHRIIIIIIITIVVGADECGNDFIIIRKATEVA